MITASFLFILSLIAYRELAQACGFAGEGRRFSLPECLGYLGIILHYGLLVFTDCGLKGYAVSLMAVFFAEAVVFVVRYPAIGAVQFISSVFSFAYAPMMLSFIYLLRIMPGGRYLAWMPFIAWICDTCAYFAGRALGRHKLAPVLSPKKTIEGAIGGILGSIAAGVGFYFLYAGQVPDISRTDLLIGLIVIAACAGGLSQVGDLTASGLKRHFDIKDYGTLIPGHGGIMDRFDSVIFISPLIYLLAALLLEGGF